MRPRGRETYANTFVSGETGYPVVVVVGYEGLRGELPATSRDQLTSAVLTRRPLRHQGGGRHNCTLLV